MNQIKRACSPDCSSWVSASAGTGKTTLLTKRIVNLLVSGTQPKSILCLTFTKAARGEMLSRINKSLKDLSKKSEDAIYKYYLEDLERTPTKNDIDFVKNLYKHYSSSSEKIQIYTTHAFCQSILQKFPIEAGVKPHFKVIDETQVRQILRRILNSAEIIKKIPKFIFGKISLFMINEIVPEFIEFFCKINTHIDYQSYKNLLLDFLSEDIVDEEQEESKLKKYIGDNLEYMQDLPIFQFLGEYLHKQTQIDNCNEIILFFLTKTLEKRKKLPSSNDENLSNILKFLQDQIYRIILSKRTNRAIDTNAEFVNLSSHVYDEFKKYKDFNNYLDYHDLINRTYELLCNSNLREWIKFKLDGGISHILVDESQDTSIRQWQIIIALLEDFYSGATIERKNPKTFFVVGDIKQSIYSFQGARPDLFSATKEYVKQKAIDSGMEFVDCTLSKTYRLPEPIFDFIHRIFAGKNLIEEVIRLECHNQKQFSSIEIWPLEKKQETGEFTWPTPVELGHYSSQAGNLAKKIAVYIKNCLVSKLYIHSKKREVRQSDFMILVQRRLILNNFLFKEIMNEGIEISGLDRLNLSESLVVKDLISVAKFVVDKNDNLNLACLLKSFIFNKHDTDLFVLLNERSLINAIETNDPLLFAQLNKIESLYLANNISDFFFFMVNEFRIFEHLQEMGLQEQIDALKAFLHEIASLYHASPELGLNDIIHLLEIYNFELKRDISSLDSVQITTIHGAKGLEAPIIIIADSADLNIDNKSNVISASFASLEVPIIQSQFRNERIQELKEQLKEEAYNEYLRLLYVALTRAQDHLIIAGIENERRNSSKDSWYDLCYKAASEYFDTKDDGILIYTEEGSVTSGKISSDILSPRFSVDHNIIPKLYQSHAILSKPTKEVNRLEFDFDDNASLIGQLYHKALELYTSTKSLDRVFDQIFLDLNFNKLTKDARSQMTKILSECVSHPFFEYLNSLENKSELEILSRADDGSLIVKRLDFVAFDREAKKIYIVDFKSDKNRSLSTKYYEQVLFYKKLLSDIYPNTQILVYLFWIRVNEFEQVYDTMEHDM
ncbi:MAG: UvrD-helicase domain-containing protein [Rickettsiaceae bacterium]|nr:UvrD-helicase domain-containing protein [Rickettsiaceae bacterium]